MIGPIVITPSTSPGPTPVIVADHNPGPLDMALAHVWVAAQGPVSNSIIWTGFSGTARGRAFNLVTAAAFVGSVFDANNNPWFPIMGYTNNTWNLDGHNYLGGQREVGQVNVPGVATLLIAVPNGQNHLSVLATIPGSDTVQFRFTLFATPQLNGPSP